ncbi:hypothetical protein ABFS82_08G096700 [Erythranthe guttata]|uniref:autophagy-related protein 13 n=1 Tax=Erythranthe guttata TaxID=4155 RepID=UPI00064E01F8|nr:PREDICTED: autophagy-related protein 13 [Erythranthe guttata]|eukprot:XP_012840413.1 PREDICTED: autophagy-related protein 13 [Erythranthe guttata]
MASYHGNPHSEPAKMEQIITEFFAKSLHIILESRSPYVSSRNYSGEQVLSSPSPSPSSSSSSSSSFRPRDKWFNLALRDCPAALENIDFWRQSNLEPMIVDVILVQTPLNFSPKRGPARNSSSGKDRHFYGSDTDEFGSEAKSEKIIERWILQYESKKSAGGGSSTSSSSGSSSKRSGNTSSHALYKKSILLLRSLYATIRLLPAYKLFRDLISSAQIRLYNLGHRVSSFVEPFTRREEADMQKFVFTPVETSCGRLCLSVLYRSSVLDLSSEPSTPISPQFIQEYVGSPMAEPLKRFPSGPISQSSPSSSSPFGRRHSWSYDIYRESPSSANPSPSPTYSEAPIHRLPPSSLPRHLHDDTSSVVAHVKNPSYDEYWPSPMFSPSPSPSPPTNVTGVSHMPKAILRYSSMPSLPNKQPRFDQLTVPKEVVAHSGLHHRLFTLSKDEPGNMLGVKPSSNSSLSFQDDSEFSGAFVLDDEDDTTDPGSRQGSFDLACGPHTSFPVKKSQDAAVGALVHMLKKATPLHQEISVVHHMQEDTTATTSSNLALSKTTADAFEELRLYREMKDSLLKQGKKNIPQA